MKGKFIIGLIGIALTGLVGVILADQKAFKEQQANISELDEKLVQLKSAEVELAKQLAEQRQRAEEEIRKTEEMIETMKELTNGIDPTKIDIQIDDDTI